MVVLSKPTIADFPPIINCKSTTLFPVIPTVDLSEPDSKHLVVKSCEEFGFFKVINHGIPLELISRLETEVIEFFSLSLSEKQKAGPPDPFGYGNRSIGPNGDVGWVEYLLLTMNQERQFSETCNNFWQIPRKAVMACELLELMADGLRIKPRNVFSKLLMDEQSDSVFRLNHYPPCSELQASNGKNMIGFGEHTDPQIISVLRSNNTSGLQISLGNGSWISVPPDANSFFINVTKGWNIILFKEKNRNNSALQVKFFNVYFIYLLQVMTNGRFKSVRHRVLANSIKSRISMIYFGGPPLNEKIAPLPSLVEGKESLYKEFTWFEYKRSAYKSRLGDNRLSQFERTAAT
ncbi:Gibberellin 2-beta-dioxygenase 1 [Vitis vinifera]|uniref:Gibberellin 2-beta-dioxygenase 1 n=1 Tax=Vitis vinifera TaxID=29760 RepID=A0A438FVG4_VITVI|nr:Gibberellin 2-beta-dioxygenase 1 [Vitis vinifera]